MWLKIMSFALKEEKIRKLYKPLDTSIPNALITLLDKIQGLNAPEFCKEGLFYRY